MANKQQCCFIQPGTERQCEILASWRIVHGSGPDDYTESCTQHVGEMLADAPEHRIYPLEGLNTLIP